MLMNDDKISREWIRKAVEEYRLKQAYDAGDEMRNTMVDWIEEDIDAAPPAPDWTPVTEGLPKEAFGCMVTVWDTDRRTQENFETVLPYPVGYDGETWNNAEGDVIPFEVIAWQPWPSPYKVPEIDLGRGV